VAVVIVTETEPVKLPPLGVIVGVAAVGKFTVRLNDVVLVTPPPVAETAMVEVPLGVAPLVVTVNVEAQVGLQVPGENDAVAPEGKPETEKATDCVLPDTNVAVIELVTDDPAVTDLLPVLLREKSKATGSDTVRLKEVVRDILPPVPVTAMGNVPAGVELLVVTVTVEEHDGPQDPFERDALAPLGTPETANETD
jgi:hypothetical protein